MLLKQRIKKGLHSIILFSPNVLFKHFFLSVIGLPRISVLGRAHPFCRTTQHADEKLSQISAGSCRFTHLCSR